MSMDETIAEVLRLDAEATQGPWDALDSSNPEDPAPFVAQTGMGDVITGDVFYTPDADIIAYYRTAAPALAREVQRLQAEVGILQEIRQRGCDCNDEDACRFAMERDDAYRRGQEKMRRRASSLFAATDDADCYWRDEDIVEAIEALEIEP